MRTRRPRPGLPRLAVFSGEAASGVLRAIAVLKNSLEVARLKRTFALQIVGQTNSSGRQDSVEVRTTDGDIFSNADAPSKTVGQTNSAGGRDAVEPMVSR